jgi:hypothetical protein
MIGAGEPFPTLSAAWAYAQQARVADGAYLHFYISSTNGNYAGASSVPFLLDQVSGSRIAIIGDNPLDDSIIFINCNGFIVDTGHSINTISGLTISYSTTTNANTVGIKADFNSSISAISNLKIVDFNAGIQATQTASITVDSTTSISGWTAYACEAQNGGSIVAPDGIALVGIVASPTIVGLYADHGAQIYAPGSNIRDCGVAAEAYDNATVDVSDSTIGENETGCEAAERGFINCSGATFNDNVNGNGDLYATKGGYIQASGASFTSSTQGGSVDGSYITQ